MKKYIAAIVLLIVFLGILTPLASSNPDGLQKVAKSLGVEQTESSWKGMMSNTFVEALKDPYVSKLVTGVLGTLIVLAASLILGIVITKRAESSRSTNQKTNR
jgi:hypothetical protein